MLAANFNEVAYFSVWVFDTGTAVGDVNEYAFGCFVVLDLNCSADG